MTPQEWTEKTVEDIKMRRKLRSEGKKQAKDYSFENMKKVQRRVNKF